MRLRLVVKCNTRKRVCEKRRGCVNQHTHLYSLKLKKNKSDFPQVTNFLLILSGGDVPDLQLQHLLRQCCVK